MFVSCPLFANQKMPKNRTWHKFLNNSHRSYHQSTPLLEWSLIMQSDTRIKLDGIYKESLMSEMKIWKQLKPWETKKIPIQSNSQMEKRNWNWSGTNQQVHRLGTLQEFFTKVKEIGQRLQRTLSLWRMRYTLQEKRRSGLQRSPRRHLHPEIPHQSNHPCQRNFCCKRNNQRGIWCSETAQPQFQRNFDDDFVDVTKPKVIKPAELTISIPTDRDPPHPSNSMSKEEFSVLDKKLGSFISIFDGLQKVPSQWWSGEGNCREERI